MDAARALRYSRRRAGLSQRRLSALTGIAQPTIARIERGLVSPRLVTFDRLLAACKVRLTLSRPDEGEIDRSAIRELLALSPGERLQVAAEEARNLDDLLPAPR